MNILEKANQIVNQRSEEKERQYGNFDDSMRLVCRLFNAMTNDKYNCTPEDMYKAMIAMKLARQANCHKEDNLLDAVAYIGALNNYIDNSSKPSQGILAFSNQNNESMTSAELIEIYGSIKKAKEAGWRKKPFSDKYYSAIGEGYNKKGRKNKKPKKKK